MFYLGCILITAVVILLQQLGINLAPFIKLAN
jgi:hypothetical protein